MTVFSRLWKAARGEGSGSDDGDDALPSPPGSNGNDEDVGISAISSFSSSSSSSSDGDVEDFLNFEATLAAAPGGGGGNNERGGVTTSHDIDDPESLRNARLAAAWFNRRSRITSDSSPNYSPPSPTYLYSGSLLRAEGLQLCIPEDGPIDLDEAMEEFEEEDDDDEDDEEEVDVDEDRELFYDTASYAHHIERMARPLESSESSSESSQGAVDGRYQCRPSSPFRSRSRPTLGVFAGDSSLLGDTQLPYYHAEFDRVSMISAATSDMTPVVCNRSEDPKGSQKKLDGIDESGRDGSGRWKQYCDYTTYQGKIALLLSAILVLALVTIVVSSTQVKNRENQPSVVNGTHHYNATNVTSWVPTPVPVPVPAPGSFAPTAPPTPASSVPFEKLQWVPIGTRLEGGSRADAFGSALAVSADATILAVGSRDASVDGMDGAGRVQLYAFDLEASSWSKAIDTLSGQSSQGGMGTAVAISDDGSMVVVGEPGNDEAGDRAGSVRTLVYDKSNGSYLEAEPLFGPGPVSFFGVAVALAGNRLVVGASAASSSTVRMAGLVQIYELDAQGRTWEAVETFAGTDDFDWLGSAVDISVDGRVVVASAPENSDVKGYVRVWRLNDEDMWVAHTDIANDVSPAKGDDRFGHSLSVSLVRDNVYRLAIGSPYKNKNPSDEKSGVVLLYELKFSTDLIETSLLGEVSGGNGDELGYSVELQQGRFLAIGSRGWNDRQGLVNLYSYDDDKQEIIGPGTKLEGTAEGDEFGSALSLLSTGNQTMLVVGASLGKSDNGSTYVSCYEPS